MKSGGTLFLSLNVEKSKVKFLGADYQKRIREKNFLTNTKENCPKDCGDVNYPRSIKRKFHSHSRGTIIAKNENKNNH